MPFAVMLHPAFTDEARRTVLTSMAQNRAAAADAERAAGPPGTAMVQVCVEMRWSNYFSTPLLSAPLNVFMVQMSLFICVNCTDIPW
jgi:hypothetical protein